MTDDLFRLMFWKRPLPNLHHVRSSLSDQYPIQKSMMNDFVHVEDTCSSLYVGYYQGLISLYIKLDPFSPDDLSRVDRVGKDCRAKKCSSLID